MSSSVISANGDSASGISGFRLSASKIRVAARLGLADPQPHEPEARLGVEDDHQDDSVARRAGCGCGRSCPRGTGWRTRARAAASPYRPVAAMLPAVSEASEVVSRLSTSPPAAMSWPFLSTTKTTRALAFLTSRVTRCPGSG